MQEIIKIAVFAICVALLSLIVKGIKPEFNVLITIVGCCLIITTVASKIGGLVNSVREIIDISGIDSEFCDEMIKISGMCFLCNFAYETCIDCGCNSIANTVETAGRICVTVSVLPFAVSLLETVSEIITTNVF